jgi:serine phosphatase RsbU (regulator of sigma subunit)
MSDSGVRPASGLGATPRRGRRAGERERLAFLAEAGVVLEASLELDDVVATVVDLCVPHLADACTLHLVEGGSLRQVGEGHRDAGATAVLAEHRGATWRADRPDVDLTAPRVVEEGDERWADPAGPVPVLRRAGARSAVLVPLRSTAGLVGVLALGRIGSAEPPLSDGTTVAELARRVAMAVANAVRYAAVDEARHRSEAVLETLRRTLVPDALPAIPGVEVASRYHAAGSRDGPEPGGDFYDVFSLRGEAWGVVLGDVCGKGPEAAVLTALTRYAVRGAAIGERSPARVLARVNEVLLADQAADRFCTVVYGRLRLRPDGVRLTLALGGHPPPLLLRADGTVSRVGVPGLPVGVFDHPDPGEELVVLDPGDVLVLYTDGVTEARSATEWYGEERLAARLAEVGPCVGAERVADAVAEDVLRFSGGVLRDDMAVLALRVR